MELDHVSHPDHKLSYSNSVQRGEKPEDCAACRDEISSEHYSCSRCNFYLHKQCAERPEELRHSLHPAHPLHLHHKSPYGALGDAECSACYKRVEGFTYHCAVCEFDLDFTCAINMSLKMELDHVFHPDHKLSYRKSVVKRGKKPEYCAACRDEISSEHYCCLECNFFLHKLCAERPQEISHSLHPLHPLRLIYKSPSNGLHTRCNACKKRVEGFIYRCAICDFDLNFTCAFPDVSKVWHSHILTFEKVVKRADKQLVCAACQEDISGPLADYYSCRECSFFLHRSCAERPRELIHPLHPQHTLHLVKKDPSDGGTTCHSCRKPMKGFVYDCRDCREFFLDFKCAFPKPEKRIQNLEQVHKHPLILNPRTSKFSCNICSSAAGDEGEEEESYVCSTCDFVIHKSCALTELIQRYKKHGHPLSLVQGVPEDLQIYSAFYCDVCHNTISQEDSVGHCARCRFFVHVSCMMTGETDLINIIKDDVDYLNNSLIQLLLNGDDFVRWPQIDVASELIQPFLLGKNGIVINAEPKIRHLSHKDHDMILFQELSINNDDFFKEEDEEILCDACIQPITAPYYSCQSCDYYLHLPCANLPKNISHSSHPQHELDLSYESKFYYCSKCDRCEQFSNGFFYECETCEFSLDLTCASLPAVIMHESHEHPLFQTKEEYDGLCYCCNEYTSIWEDKIFKCRSCDVYLHYNCAMYSRSIRHRWDRQHPLDLRYPPHSDHPDHIMCDICEELVHPTLDWLFSCFECKVSFHTGCAPKYDEDPNVKYGGKVKISFHPHILKYLRIATLKTTCDKCKIKLYTGHVFECETCYYCICSGCVIKRNWEIQ